MSANVRDRVTALCLDGQSAGSAVEFRLDVLPRGIAVVVVSPGGLDADAPRLMEALAEHGYESVAAQAAPDLLAALIDHVASRGYPPEGIGLVGLGAGALSVARAAGDRVLGAAVSIVTDQPAGPADPLAPLLTPWLGLYPADGDLADFDGATVARARIARSKVHGETVVYPHVRRDFLWSSTDGVGHAAAYDAWQRVIEWLNQRVAPPLSPAARAWAAANS